MAYVLQTHCLLTTNLELVLVFTERRRLRLQSLPLPRVQHDGVGLIPWLHGILQGNKLYVSHLQDDALTVVPTQMGGYVSGRCSKYVDLHLQ